MQLSFTKTGFRCVCLKRHGASGMEFLFTGLRPPLASAFSIPLRSRPFLYTSVAFQMHLPASTSGTPGLSERVQANVPQQKPASGATPPLKYAVERPAQPVNAQDVR